MQGPDLSGIGWLFAFAIVGMLAAAGAVGYGLVFLFQHLEYVP